MQAEANQSDSSYVCIDEIKIKDFKDCILKGYLLNKEEDSKYPHIKKWLQYDLFAKEDADEVLKKSDILVQKLKWYDETDNCKKRYLDCIFSMRTHFNMFLRLYEPRAAFSHSWLLYYFDEVFSDKSITEFCEEKKIDKDLFKNCLDELDRLAENTHTIGNYMPCPDETYNKVKGFSKGFVFFNDRIELLLHELKKGEHNYIDLECANNWKEWFEKNVKKLCLEELFKGDYKNINITMLNESLLVFPIHKKIGRVYKFECNDIASFKDYLKFVNDWIITRGINLLNNIK
ncbi:hypothetical protein K2F40_15475 [Clostridium sp. CM028]|uniref:hypothetical protein n=1 Tax=Clostridium sp. CM028 TaxID=2851575 RepID=UPI001C6E79E8|nr:hypothetical protein [Clostridium sp. CM028]MBW9150359.1 hypothetical protein [Clostridium sp. CM028]WLC63536.1 hypothetical protein KTC94_17485 [Clostridium sp. CM028]